MKRTSGDALAKVARPDRRDSRANRAIARSAAAVLGQLYQWRPGLKHTRAVPRERGPFDVHAVFDSLKKK